MKKATHATKMRWTGAALYLLIFLLQLFLTRYFLTTMSVGITNIPLDFYGPLLLLPASAVMAIWMFAGKNAVSGEGIRAITAGTALLIIFELLTYDAQAGLINVFFSNSIPSLAEKDIWVYVVIILRLVLFILAAFFVASSRDAASSKEVLADSKVNTEEAVTEQVASEEKAKDAEVEN